MQTITPKEMRRPENHAALGMIVGAVRGALSESHVVELDDALWDALGGAQAIAGSISLLVKNHMTTTQQIQFWNNYMYMSGRAAEIRTRERGNKPLEQPDPITLMPALIDMLKKNGLRIPNPDGTWNDLSPESFGAGDDSQVDARESTGSFERPTEVGTAAEDRGSLRSGDDGGVGSLPPDSSG